MDRISYENRVYKGNRLLGGDWEVTRKENGKIITQEKPRKLYKPKQR